MEPLHERLARLRQAAGLTQREVATALGIKSPSVAQWEGGRSRPDIERLPALARLYKVTVEELCGADFPAIEQQGRLDLLAMYDVLDEDNRMTLLKVAEGLAAKAANRPVSEAPFTPKPAAAACVTPIATIREVRR